MIQLFIVSSLLLLVGILGMSFRVFFIKNGRFSSHDVGADPHMLKNGISCATSQDRETHKQAYQIKTYKNK